MSVRWLFSSWIQLFIAIVSAIISIILIVNQKEPPNVQTGSLYTSQIQTHDGVERSLKILTSFVRQQRQMIQEAQGTLEGLKKEQDKLKPLVEADHRVVESLLQIQAEIQNREIWSERAIGFFIGIAASLVASFLFSFVGVRKKH